MSARSQWGGARGSARPDSPSKQRSVAMSYAKDLVVGKAIKIDQLESYAKAILKFIRAEDQPKAAAQPANNQPAPAAVPQASPELTHAEADQIAAAEGQPAVQEEEDDLPF